MPPLYGVLVEGAHTSGLLPFTLSCVLVTAESRELCEPNNAGAGAGAGAAVAEVVVGEQEGGTDGQEWSTRAGAAVAEGMASARE
mmetsp:Transcript_28063/g.75815  ORF Transcript_28063/g.75815 Transcript_28063/m.75815 type:complete len:85 (+) Transcript_28063:163-417(+)